MNPTFEQIFPDKPIYSVKNKDLGLDNIVVFSSCVKH